jgi:adenylate kinase
MSGDNTAKKWVVIFVGPPGSGKDTQAELISEEFGLVNLKTSHILALEKGDQTDPVIKKEKELHYSGQLNSVEFVQNCLINEIRRTANDNKGIVLSGSPRRIAEAEGETSIFEELYGHENIKVIYIELSENESVKRNSSRRVCELNLHPIIDIPANHDLKTCPKDGSPIVIRSIDDPETIKIRYRVYLEETKPLIDFLAKKGYNIITINGEQSIEDVHRQILNKLW